MSEPSGKERDGYLADVRVVELADEQAEYCGRLLAGLGADVLKVEPPEGAPTRRIGPFYRDEPGPENSLYFWHYNLGKRSLLLDLETRADRARLEELLERADVLLESTRRGTLDGLGLGGDSLAQRFPRLIHARMTPFGDTGPWRDYRGSDLIHLALGGPMMNSGYDPQPDGHYDLPPIAPQMWHAYHIAGEQLANQLIGALQYRRRTGKGQVLSCAVHEAVSKNTELDVMEWVFRRAPFYRQTGRHAAPVIIPHGTGRTKDGRWIIGEPGMGAKGWPQTLDFLRRYDAAGDLDDERYAPKGSGLVISFAASERGKHINEVLHRLMGQFAFEDVPWGEAQDAGMMWAPLRRPEENVPDPHWKERGTFAEVEHPELGRSFAYPVAKWVSSEVDWVRGPRAPRLGEHTESALAEVRGEGTRAERISARADTDKRRSRWGKPFALSGVRILDFTWWLASGGGPRFLSALGAEDIRVEWKDAPDLRVGMAQLPVGGKAAREKATEMLPPDTSSINRSGQINDFHAGQKGISLNLRHPKGLELAKRLVAQCDIVAEGFSPGVLARWGLSYDVMRELKPDLIYVQQSGFGQSGRYGRYRTGGPIAQAIAGISEMSGLPTPYQPVGWGYSYLDWFGAYSFATAMLAALHYRERTGKGQWIDASQVEAGIYLTGTAVLDWSANGRSWERYGNRSPYKPAAPHGAYRCAGDDRWLAIACFDENDWRALVAAMGHPAWASDPRFADLKSRLAHQDELDHQVTSWTGARDAYDAMDQLQRAGVAAGVCQTGADRVDRDPQLQALEWFTEVTGTELGTWPVKEIPVHMSETPPFMGGEIDRGAPCYGEDNESVYGELLGLSRDDLATLAEEGVL